MGKRTDERDPYISRNPTPLATRTAKESALRIQHLSALALATVLGLGACDRLGEIVIVPEQEILDSFETGIGAWSLRSGDLGTPPGTWSVVGTQEAASDGNHALRIQLDNIGGAGKVWVVREVQLSPNQDYDVDLAFDLGTSDASDATPWTLIAGAHPTDPQNASGLTFRGGTVPDAPGTSAPTWVEEEYQFVLRVTAEGRGVVALGVWGTTAEDRVYYLDNVRVSFTRR